MFEKKRISTLNLKQYQLLIVVLIVLFCQKISAITYYVNDNSTTGDLYSKTIGNDANDGLTVYTPKLTLESAYNIATTGDIIYVDTGNYSDINTNGQILFENKKKVKFILTPKNKEVYSKNAIPTNEKINPTTFYIENDKPIEQAVYLQHKRNGGKKS